MGIKTHTVRGKKNKNKVKTRKQQIIAKLYNENIHVTNFFNVDGNTARRFYKNSKKMAEILKVPEYLISDIGTIWTTICSGFAIDAVAFGKFCDDFMFKFKNDKSINWYEPSPTLHKGPNHLLL